MKPSDDNVAKTRFGIVQSLDELFTDFLYCPEQRTERRVWAPSPDGYFFFGSESPKIQSFMRKDKNPFAATLYAKPTGPVHEYARYRLFGFAGEDPETTNAIGGFKLIPWPHAGHALIAATPRNVGTCWLAFLPLENVPELDIRIWDGKNHVEA